jgi:hypothetical protein
VKKSEGKRPSELAPADLPYQDEIVNSQTINLPNIIKTSSSPGF